MGGGNPRISTILLMRIRFSYKATEPSAGSHDLIALATLALASGYRSRHRMISGSRVYALTVIV